MKIYLAAKYGSRIEMRSVRDALEEDGHKVVSSWIDQDIPDDESVTEEALAACAKIDVAEVLLSEVLVTFSHKRGELHSGGGRHVEFGVALQSGRKIIVVGPKGEHVFHFWPGVNFAADLAELTSILWSMEPE